MEPELITYRKFDDIGLAEELTALLDEHKIDYVVNEESLTFDPSFAFNPLAKNWAVKIKEQDFGKVNQLLEESELENIAQADKDYYLFGFSNEELMEVITKADEWSVYDNLLARKILADRGKVISDEAVESIKEERIEQLKKPEPSQMGWIIMGYLIAFTPFIMPFFLTIISIFIGWHLSTYKKTLPDGERVLGYNETDRKHGKRIFWLGIVMFTGALAYLLL